MRASERHASLPLGMGEPRTKFGTGFGIVSEAGDGPDGEVTIEIKSWTGIVARTDSEIEGNGREGFKRQKETITAKF
ncbi:hypothetical protein EVAR_40151_1 [Eumeta japonica]|uniref:Uncharacterized protein n=1 Tax=Eumeta variegata TaxID=151549 RepID=A0A4C1YD60_EUMVA|nr:hypothetical protein EVAR_40151_1 [Eumeta japonica]